MKSFLKSLFLIIIGVLLAAGLLYTYSVFFKTAGSEVQDESLQFVPIMPGDAVISMISGEVYLIREEKILTPRAGDAVLEGDVIKVVDDSWCQVHFVGKATMKLRSNTLVRIQKLLTSTVDADIRTELLTGSMIYKVDRLDTTDNLEVIAQEKIYRVEGTEFIVEAYAGGGSRVAVNEGSVSVLLKQEGFDETLLKTVPSGSSLNLKEWKQEDPLPEMEDLDTEDQRLFDEEGPASLLRKEEEMVYLEIRTVPEGAQLYLDGRLSGRSRISGLFSRDESLKLLARKRGFHDSDLTVTAAELNSPVLIIRLEPLGLEESLMEEKNSRWPETLDEIKARYERESEILSSGFELKIKERDDQLNEMNSLTMSLQKDLKSLRSTNSGLETENSELEEELRKSLEAQKKLRDLLTQIQELSDQ